MDCWTAGLAIFAMFFGAGNIIFPLVLGKCALNQTPWALLGLLLTAVVVPFVGLWAMFCYKGQIGIFFSRLGKIPGFCIACLTIALLGPLGSAPRCLALAYSTLSMSIPGLSLIGFSAVACLLIFLFVYRKNKLLQLLGYVLSPFKIILLVVIMIKGLAEAPHLNLISSQSAGWHLWHGLKEGYNTMDLLAAFFFAPVILGSLARSYQGPSLERFVLKASVIGAVLLAVVYVGFCYLAYLYAPILEGVPSDRLLATIAIQILGSYAGLIMGLTISIACLTTAIALIAAFVAFLHQEVLKEKVAYLPLLILSLLATFAVAILKFQGIACFLSPVLQVCYPVLMILTLYNLIKVYVENRLRKQME
ncbi:MAG: branched-chain amino acid transport system II carrier protein [Verrucomicrobia bacterium]|nr:branched-chain amino acid transport system II carrier protein [Verrucomicrobiota bacterium]